MEPALIDWENVESRCVRDELFEGFNAPKWVDFNAAIDNAADTNVGDDAWFCRPDCNHPKTAEDFLKMSLTSPTNSKVFHQRDGKPKKRGILVPLSSSSSSPKTRKPSSAKKNLRRDVENQNPNVTSGLDTTGKVALTAMRKAAKENVKSSEEKPRREEASGDNYWLDPPLKSDIFSKISEICCEIKQMTPTIQSVVSESESHTDCDSSDKVTATETDSTARYWNCCGTIGGGCGEECRRLALFEKKQEVRSCPPTPQRIPLRPADLETKGGVVKEAAVPEKKKEDEESVTASGGGGSGDVFWFLNPCGYFGR